MPLSAKEYIGEESFNALTSDQQNAVSKAYDHAMEIYNDMSKPQEDVDIAFGKLDELLTEYGIDSTVGMGQAPGFSDFLATLQDKISEEDYAKLTALEEEMQSAETDEAYEAVLSKMDLIFGKLGLNAKEVMTSIENGNQALGLYNVRNAKITQDKDNAIVDSEEYNGVDPVHQKVWDHIVKIIPKKYMEMITKFEVNTDGEAGVMAHVIDEKSDYSKWRLAIDLKDSVNDDGSFNEEFNNTIVHEMFHIATLNKAQIEQGLADSSQLVLPEGTMAKDSYLNKFHQAFWLTIKDEHQAMVDEQGGDSNQADMYAFYEKYPDQFVSDYAATNVVEDIAESFRVFVIEDKPTDDTIKSQKVLFFYNYPELVKYRDDIRSSLNL